MKIGIYPKTQLEQLWKENRKRFKSGGQCPPACLRCGEPLNSRLAKNMMSRQMKVYVCAQCGDDETGRNAIGEPLPMGDWNAVTEGLICGMEVKDPTLKPFCVFDSVFQEPTKPFPMSPEHPVSELIYSRSDYDGTKWWTTWFRCDDQILSADLTKEIEEFSASLFQMPEFKTLDGMRSFCVQAAQSTNDPTEYNLYAGTKHFHVWLRLITRFRDYNLYCHFYLKDMPAA